MQRAGLQRVDDARRSGSMPSTLTRNSSQPSRAVSCGRRRDRVWRASSPGPPRAMLPGRRGRERRFRRARAASASSSAWRAHSTADARSDLSCGTFDLQLRLDVADAAGSCAPTAIAVSLVRLRPHGARQRDHALKRLHVQPQAADPRVVQQRDLHRASRSSRRRVVAARRRARSRRAASERATSNAPNSATVPASAEAVRRKLHAGRMVARRRPSGFPR